MSFYLAVEITVNALKQIALSMAFMVVLAFSPIGIAQAQVKVTAATPASTQQGTVSLDVTVDGSGFNGTAKPRFLVTGTTDTGGITVRKVVVKSSNQLVATIDVADTAVVNKFDIEVTLDSGRKGKGTTLFTVLKKTATAPDPCLTSSPQGGVVTESTFPSFVFFRSTQLYGNWVDWSLYLADATGKCERNIGFGGSEIPNMRYDSATHTALIVNVGPGGLVGMNVPITFNSTTGPVAATLLDPPPTLLNVANLPSPTGLTPADGWYLYGMADFLISPDGTQILFNISYTDAVNGSIPTKWEFTFWTCTLVAAGPSIDPATCTMVRRARSHWNWSAMAGWGAVPGTVYVTEQASADPNQISLYRLTLATGEFREVFSDGTPLRAVSASIVAGRELVAVSEEGPSRSFCSKVVVIDAYNCPNGISTCAVLNNQGQGNWARAFTWLPDGRVAAEGQTAPDRKGRCTGTGTVVTFPAVDPNGTPATTLTQGARPDGAG